MIPALRRQKQVEFCEFKVYRVNSRTTKDTQKNPVLKNKKQNKEKKEKEVLLFTFIYYFVLLAQGLTT